MQAVISLLPQPIYKQVEEIWKELDRRFTLMGVQVTPFPHLTWQVAEDYDLETLPGLLEQLAVDIRPIPIRTAGLGIFTGPSPVVYVAVINSPYLSEVQHTIWKALDPIASQPVAYYLPNMWIPHISLAYGDLVMDLVDDVMEWLLDQDYNWSMTIDNIAYVYAEPGKSAELRYRYALER
jgi:hypothetical protein